MPQAAEQPIFTDDAIRRAIAALAESPAFQQTPEEAAPLKDYGSSMHRWGLPTLYGGMLADILTTLWALKSNPSAREGNPLVGPLGMGGLLAAKVGANGLAGWALDKRAHKGAKWAAPLSAVLGGVQGAAAINNARHIR